MPNMLLNLRQMMVYSADVDRLPLVTWQLIGHDLRVKGASTGTLISLLRAPVETVAVDPGRGAA